MTHRRITADAAVQALTIASAIDTVQASTTQRTLSGELVRYATCRATNCSCCTYGRTSVGRLKVAPGALRLPNPVDRVKLTREHDRAAARGHAAAIISHATGIRAAMRVSDGQLGDDALTEAADHTRDGFSYDVIDARIEGDTLVDGLLIAVGQCGIPAYDDMRIDTIAASQTHQGTQPEGNSMTEEQRRRLAELRAIEARTAEQQQELDQLAALEGGSTSSTTTTTPAAPAAATPAPAPAPAPAQQQVAASIPAVPGGVPRQPATTQAVDPLTQFVRSIVDGYRGNNPVQAITAALSDITHTAHSDNIAAPGWSGELWGGLAYEPIFTPMLASGDLTSYEGKGWRWVVKPAMADYAGDKAAIPTSVPTTEPGTYEAARMAVGHDIDRKFYDFPDEAFLRSYVEAVRESWAMKLDGKVEAYINSNAVAATIGGVAVAAQATPLKAAAKAIRALQRNRVGRATFVIMNDADYDTLMDFTNDTVPAFLDLFGIDPKMFTASSVVPDNTVVAGVRQAGTVRTLPGSPIRASAQHIANGGIDEAFFGYWAVEEHHTSGIVKVTVTP